MIIHHPNKAGDDWLGSVAWNNKVRSRLILEKGEDEDDPDARQIRNPKANYGPNGGKVAFRWHRGTFVREDDLPPDTRAELTDAIKVTGENAAFLACLRERAAQGDARAVGPSPGPNYAPSQFEGMAQAKGLKKPALKRAMDRLFSIGRIEAHTYRNKAKSRDVTIIREVPEGIPNAIPNASRTLSPNLPDPRPEHPRAHTVGTTYQEGAAHEAAAPSHERS